MSRCETTRIPFIMVGNKQALTDRQFAEQPWLSEFMFCFPHCFERDDARQCYYFYQEGVPA